MDSTLDLLLSLGIPEDNITRVTEPENSEKILLKFEQKYGIDTIDVFDSYITGSMQENNTDIDSTTLNTWIDAYHMYTYYGGDNSKINTISKSSYIIENIDKKGASNEALFLSLRNDI